MTRAIIPLLVEARRHLLVSQGSLGELLGVSKHTGQRWERGASTPGTSQLHALARLVHPHSPELAADIALAGGSTLGELGIGLPPPRPAAPPPPDPVHVVDSVVCAAAEAIQLMPDAVRPALRAAFRRARLVGLSVAAVEAALGAPDPGSKAPAVEARPKKTPPSTGDPSRV